MPSITITEVAQLAGVSIKTVSRVLNAEPHVREEVRQRVFKAAGELNYRPQVSARSLAGARSYIVGFLMTVPSPYAAGAQGGALDACRRLGRHLLVESLDLEAPDLATEVDALASTLPVEGVILLAPACDSEVVMDALDRQGVPYVRIAPAKMPERSFSVEVDDEQAAYVMTRLLLELGHRRIGFIRGLEDHSASTRRLQGFRRGLAELGLEAREPLVQPGQFIFASGQEAATRLLASPEPPTAIFASNDLMAFGVMSKARELGYRIPDDLSVSGFDDIPLAGMIWPGLTTMAQPLAEMAFAAAEAVIAGAARAPLAPSSSHPLFKCRLVVRGSTAPPRTG